MNYKVGDLIKSRKHFNYSEYFLNKIKSNPEKILSMTPFSNTYLYTTDINCLLEEDIDDNYILIIR